MATSNKCLPLLPPLARRDAWPQQAGQRDGPIRTPVSRLARAMNRDVLVPRPAGRFLFGRLIGTEGTRLHILPLGPAQRQLVVTNPPWLAVAVRLVRAL